jgi:uncharacterized protein HemX
VVGGALQVLPDRLQRRRQRAPAAGRAALNQLRLALSLTIEQAQWAALNGEAKVYTQALDDARSVLLANFNPDNPQSKAMLDSLNQLAEQPVSVVTPDLSESLAAVQAYIQRRHLPAEAEGASHEASTCWRCWRSWSPRRWASPSPSTAATC